MTNSPGIAIRRLKSVDDTQVEALADVLIAAGERALLVAEDDAGIVGTVQLVLDLPENQPHRADLSKMLVHRRARRRGLGAALVRAAEQTARDSGKTLLVLDTNEGSDAERLYARLGWVRVGTIPGYSVEPRGGLRGTTLCRAPRDLQLTTVSVVARSPRTN